MEREPSGFPFLEINNILTQLKCLQLVKKVALPLFYKLKRRLSLLFLLSDGMNYPTVFSSAPMPSISQRTTSPGRMYFGGSKAMPTPEGVPMAMMVPARRVMPWVS